MNDPVDLLAGADPLAAFRRAHAAGQQVALRTSGTTTTPRTVLRTTDSWVDSFDHVARLTGLSAASRVWIPGPLTATMNLFAAVHADWVGATRVAGLTEATHAYLTPAALRRLLAEPAVLAGVRVVVAGDRLDPATLASAHAAGAQVSHYYGAAELSFVAWADGETLRLFPGVEAQARDGELWVRSPYLCAGYLEPDQVAMRDADGWVTVGDRGLVRGSTLEVHGRAGGITTAGATVLVADVERVLRPQARGDVVVTGVAHPDLGEVVVAVVTDAADVAPLKALARTALMPPQRPRRWVHRATLPLTRHGKVDRAALTRDVSTEREDA
ncbi:AMP-binding protein [Nocardioides daphniae]|uniref:O-succinylbenzoate--CoA ligase n=1 Tax=Nocardioides daphniae TaxID=402297 RepID=A0A4P7UDZ1_9ACTN|nr:AMP-binding protein [Nocardioides daphniae]QCC78512.1 o-succinylbenzoate--CoA ligase [Nocardioides daphniae]GGD11793.1 hypothetical protein GCM10007231_08320 [Nocardioides daphniae]